MLSPGTQLTGIYDSDKYFDTLKKFILVSKWDLRVAPNRNCAILREIMEGILMKHQRSPKQNKNEIAFALLSLVFLKACGGGGSGSSGSSDGATQALSGAVVKGPLSNALVFLDYDGDGQLSSNEPSVLTNESGEFSINSTRGSVDFIAKSTAQTIDTSSGEAVTNVTLSAPKGSSVVTPMTTIMKEANLSASQVKKALGLPDQVDPTNFNPFASGANAADALVVEIIAQQVMTTVTTISAAAEGAGLSGDEAFSAALSSVVAVVKENATSSAQPIDLTDASTLEAVTASAQTAVANISSEAAESFDAVAANVNAAMVNVNTKFEEITDLTSADTKAIFSIVTDLNEQVKVAAKPENVGTVQIEFADAAAVDQKAAENAVEISAPPVVVVPPPAVEEPADEETVAEEESNTDNSSSAGGSGGAEAEDGAPSVVSVSSSTADGTVGVGDTISIIVRFDEKVTVTGTPTLELTLDGGAVDASYSSGSGTKELVFTYTVQANDAVSDLNYS